MAQSRHAYTYIDFDRAALMDVSELIRRQDDRVIWSLVDRIHECRTSNSYYDITPLIQDIVDEVPVPIGMSFSEASDLRGDIEDKVTDLVWDEMDESDEEEEDE